MLDFLIRKSYVQSAQGFIDKLNPQVNAHLSPELPLPSAQVIKKMAGTVSKINAMEPHISKLSDEALKKKTEEFKARYQKTIEEAQNQLQKLGASLAETSALEEKEPLENQVAQARDNFKKAQEAAINEVLPEAFAVVREVGKRILSMRHFDVQLIGGMVLHQGSISEMSTGEGKTLVATLPAYLNALTGQGVHIVTVNDYLAKRDREWMGPLYEFLGLTVGVIQHDMDHLERKEAYACDITYGTNNEFGFDYLRDNMVNFKEEMVQRGHFFAIVDEVDSILIDEARTPLIISGPAEESTDKYYRANDVSKHLKGKRITERDEIDAKYKSINLAEGVDYLADEKAKSISLTESGEEKTAKLFGIANLHDMETIEFRHHILQALRAKEFFKNDVDYVVREGKVMIVDEFTGRLMPGRRWSDGLHQAIEAREGIKIERENQTLATITFQNYFRMYEKLAGMTGTAYTEANEFKQIYKLDCIVVPTNRPLKRINHADSIYKTLKEKFNAVVEEIEECHKKGQPVLVGTISIEKSEILASMLKRKGIPHQVLNAKFHEMEAHIIAQAGRFKGVTIATNMAGRGTDILLGGNAEYLAKSLAEEKSQDKENKEEKEALIKKFLAQYREQVQKEHEEVVASGGLHVIGTERHESRRIDNQLRGRSGRQGDPGSSRFYVSLEDDLMRLFGSEKIMALMSRLGMEEGQVLEHPWLTGAIETAQKRVEAHNFEIRKHLLEYDDVMNRQREVIYGMRRGILESRNIKETVLGSIHEVVDREVQGYLTTLKEDGSMDSGGLILYLKAKFNCDLSSAKEKFENSPAEEAKELVRQKLIELYEKKGKDFGEENLRHLERMFLLHTIDSKWKDHLYAMDQIKEGIGLRSYGQRDPLVEYKREAFSMFQEMYDSINLDVAETIFKIEPVTAAGRVKGVFSALPQQLVHQEFSSLSSQPILPQREAPTPQSTTPAATPLRKNEPKVGRNDPCPCGSGKKYKKCCGANA